jgi:mRNA interferase MazF
MSSALSFYNPCRAFVLAYIGGREPAKKSKKEGLSLMNRKIRRGDMFCADLTPGIGSEQSGYRPVLILSNNTGNRYSRTIIAAIITSRTDNKYKMPTHCRIKAQQGLGRDSYVLLEQIRTLDKARLREYIGTLAGDAMRMIDKALTISVGLKYISDS